VFGNVSREQTHEKGRMASTTYLKHYLFRKINQALCKRAMLPDAKSPEKLIDSSKKEVRSSKIPFGFEF